MKLNVVEEKTIINPPHIDHSSFRKRFSKSYYLSLPYQKIDQTTKELYTYLLFHLFSQLLNPTQFACVKNLALKHIKVVIVYFYTLFVYNKMSQTPLKYITQTLSKSIHLNRLPFYI